MYYATIMREEGGCSIEYMTCEELITQERLFYKRIKVA